MSDAKKDIGWVRTEHTPDMPPPASTVGVVGWVRENLASGPGHIVLTLIGCYLIYLLIPPLINFAFVNAIWEASNGQECRPAEGGHAGACWPYVAAYFDQFIYGRYPFEERWRVDIVYFLLVVGMAPLMVPKAPFKRINVLFMFVGFPIIAYFLLTGGMGMEVVKTDEWGGVLVTLVVALTGIVASLPIGILLALGRRSKMPIVKTACVIFIEFWRGVPLITVLFMSSVMLPLFLPEGVNFDKLLRALIGVALFSSAYMAEVIRGGLQAIPRGQYEGAQALGLNFPKMMGFIVLPQALKLVIPGIVNTFIGLFKDTTLVLIIGLFDLLGMVQSSFTDSNWASPTQSHTGYLVAAIFFWICCFGMSRYSIFWEDRLHTGHKR